MTAWLTIIGIGEDGLDGLGSAAHAALAEAQMFFGGERHLAMLPDDGRPRHIWQGGGDAMLDAVLARRGQSVCVLASGNPMWFGIGSRLAKRLESNEMVVFPALSTLSLTCARLGWRESDVVTVTLHGRPAATLEPQIAPGARLMILCAGPETPAEVARRLNQRGFGPSRIIVLERLGGARERIRETTATGFDIAGFDIDDIDPLNAVAVECRPGPDAKVLSTLPGLPDDSFEHDGQITKCETRAVTLARLMPMANALLWDVGAGSGSIAIEWMRSAPRARAIAIEKQADRAHRIRTNAEALGVPGIEIVEGSAPSALGGLAAPDAVFVGGGLAGGDAPEIIAATLAALRPGGRLVANAVTIASESALVVAQSAHGGALTRIAISRAAPIGQHQGWQPLMPVTQWSLTKPWGPLTKPWSVP